MDSQNLCGLWCYIALQDLETSDDNCPHLHRDRHDVGASFSRSSGVLILDLLRVRLDPIVLSDEISSVRIHVSFVGHSEVTFKKPPGEIVRGSGRPVLKPFPDVTSTGVCDGDEEVRGGLTICRIESEIDEVLASESRRTEIGHATFVDEADFIEEFTHALRSLIGGEDSSDASGVRCNAESSSELQGRRGV